MVDNSYFGRYPLPPPPPPEDYGGPVFPLSPAAIVYLFPEYFSEKASIGGFRSPCGNIKVKHDSLLCSMVIATLLGMEDKKIIEFYVYREGRILKRNRLGIVKTNNLVQVDFGYLGRRIVNMYPGSRASLYRVIIEGGERFSPEKYFIGQVFKYDIRGKGLFLEDNPKKPICEKIMIYRNEAEKIYNSINVFRAQRSNEYNLAKWDVMRVILDMQPSDDY